MSNVQQIDKALGRYYSKLGVDDYFDNNRIGLFQAWCDENGFDDDGIKEELNENPTDCTIIEFDENFPLQNKTSDPNERAQQIINVIQECYSDPDAFSGKLSKIFPQISKNFFDIDEKKDIEEIKRIYSNQCAAIFDTAMLNDRDILKLIAVGRKHGISYLQHLADTYSRDRILYEIQNKDKHRKDIQALTESIWSAKGNSKIFDTIRTVTNEQHAISTLSAITSFFRRVVPKLIFNDTSKIKDLIAPTAQYMTSAVLWVSKLAKEIASGTKCPFQVDICIAYQQAVSNQIFVNDATKQTEEKQQQKSFDCVGDIEQRLQQNNLFFITKTVDASKEKLGIGSSARVFQKVFDEYRKGIKYENYPHKKRFIVFIDRRKKDTQADTMTMFEPPDNCKFIPNTCVNLWYFSASRSCIIPNIDYRGDVLDAVHAVSYHIIEQIQNEDINNGIIKDTLVYAIYVAAIRERKKVHDGVLFNVVIKVDGIYYDINVWRSVEPITYVLKGNVERDNEFKEMDEMYDICDDMKLSTKQKLLRQNIKSNDHCKGALLTLSFHVIQQDEIKMYLYINGQMCRFMPQDIRYILPKFFDPQYNKGKNAAWPKCKEVNTLLRIMNGKINDVEFDAFYKKYKSDIQNVKKNENIFF